MPWWRSFPARFVFVLMLGLSLSVIGSLPGAPTPANSFDLRYPGPQSETTAGLKLEAFPDRNQVHPGGHFMVYLMVTLEPGWHIYSLEPQDDPTLPTRIELAANAFSPKNGWTESDPQIVEDRILNRMIKVHASRAEFQRLFTVPDGLKPGPYSLQGTFTYRSCDNKVCTRPRQIGFNTRIDVLPDDRT